MADHIAVLRDAGVRNVTPWMGVGGVEQHQVLRSMRLFAEHVMSEVRGWGAAPMSQPETRLPGWSPPKTLRYGELDRQLVVSTAMQLAE